MATIPTLFIALVLAIGCFDSANGDCHPRLIEPHNDAAVCVCTEKLCDNFDYLNHLSKVQVNRLVTNRHGDRLKLTELNFTKEAPVVDEKSPSYLVVDIDRTKKHHKMIGFGGAFTDSATITIDTLPKDLQERIMKDYFGPDGIEYRMSRVPIAGCDESIRMYSYDDKPEGETLNSFALQDEDLKYKIPLMQLAKKVSKHELKFFASPWSAPGWMKTTGTLNKDGVLKGEPGGPYYKAFAKYTRLFLENYKKHNISFWGVSPENEPQFGHDPNFKYENMGLNRTNARDYIKMDLVPELQKNGFADVGIIGLDDSIDRDFNEYVSTMLDDKEVAKHITYIGYHWYGNRGHYQRLSDIQKKYPDKPLFNTEACQFIKKIIPYGSWGTFNMYADDLFQTINRGVVGWNEWNFALNLQAGPSWMGQTLNAPIIVNATAKEYYRQPFFYVMGHFSKFVEPDSVRVETHVTKQMHPEGVQLLAFVRPDKSVLFMTFNQNTHPVKVYLNDPEKGHLNLDISAESLESFIWY